MKLYVCWGTFQTPRPGGHPCHNAYEALKEAGHDPEVVRCYGLGWGPSWLLQNTPGRHEVRELTGQKMVPVLVTDEGEAVHDSRRIVEWAKRNPAGVASPP